MLNIFHLLDTITFHFLKPEGSIGVLFLYELPILQGLLQPFWLHHSVSYPQCVMNVTHWILRYVVTYIPVFYYDTKRKFITVKLYDELISLAVFPFVDTMPPTITNCPDNMTKYVLSGSPDPTVEWNVPSASDDDSDVNFVNATNHPGDTFPRGVTMVTYTYEDQSGNQATCVFTVMVIGKYNKEALITFPKYDESLDILNNVLS